MDLKTIIQYLAENYEVREEKNLLIKRVLKLISEIEKKRYTKDGK